MSDSSDPRAWLRYADENLQVANLALPAGLLHPCLQNAQQAVEKALKALLVSRGLPPHRTHSIRELNNDLRSKGVDAGLSDSDCDLLDSIFVDSKYPPDAALPLFTADEAICRQCLALAGRVLAFAKRAVGVP